MPSNPSVSNPPVSDRDEVVGGPPQELPPLPEDRDAARKAASREFPCPQCGATLAFDPGAQSLQCPHCGHRADIALPEGRQVVEQDLRAVIERLAAKKSEEATLAVGVFELQCSNCGATVQFTGALTATSCAYCAAPVQREGVHDAKERVPVDGVLPFRVENAQARQNLKSWTKSRWFLPSALLRDGIQANFQGIYLPFFTFDALTSNRFSGQRGIRHTMVVGSGKSRRVITYYTWHPVAGSFQRFFDDQLENAGSGLPDAQMRELEPWPLKGLRPFSHEYMTGFLARTYEVPLDRCFTAAKQRMTAELEADVRRRIGGDAQRIDSIETAWPGLMFKHVLLPVWLTTYRWKEKNFRVVVNAATGEVQGERPWSFWK